MTLIVHGRATSSNVQAVMWTAAELGLEVARRDVGGRFGGNDDPGYRAINPMGLVPSLEDGPLKIFESGAIMRYLLSAYGPRPFEASPEADMWAEWAKWTLTRAWLVPVFWGYYRAPEGARDMEAVMAGQRAYEALLAMAMRQRGAGPWMRGARISLADIWVGHLLYRYFTLDLPRQVPEGAEGYYAMLQQREAFRRHVMVDYSELKGRPRA